MLIKLKNIRIFRKKSCLLEIRVRSLGPLCALLIFSQSQLFVCSYFWHTVEALAQTCPLISFFFFFSKSIFNSRFHHFSPNMNADRFMYSEWGAPQSKHWQNGLEFDWLHWVNIVRHLDGGSSSHLARLQSTCLTTEMACFIVIAGQSRRYTGTCLTWRNRVQQSTLSCNNERGGGARIQ